MANTATVVSGIAAATSHGMMPPVAEVVSTIIPVYNRAGLVAASVQSVLDQTYRPVEIILVDDGSTDNTLEELHRLAAEQPEIIRVAHRENGGPGLARETGRLLARGEFIQYLDSDDLLLPHKFEVQVAALRAHLECDIAYGRTRLIDECGVTLLETSKWTGKIFERLFPALLVDRWWHTQTPLYRRRLCDEIGPWLKQQPEDWDYDARAGALGARLVFCDDVVSCQRVHGGDQITKRPYSQFLPQEAWFLPRLHACAIKAGVREDEPEMRHFSRWAYSLSRRTAIAGMAEEAATLLTLACRAHHGFSLEMTLYRQAVRILGLRRAAGYAERLYRICRTKRFTMPQSAGWYRTGNSCARREAGDAESRAINPPKALL